MTALLALVFAASLASSDVGEFFTLPTWLPSSVASANTPGSDPAAGGGWYIEEYTNRVDWSAWEVTGGNSHVTEIITTYGSDYYGTKGYTPTLTMYDPIAIGADLGLNNCEYTMSFFIESEEDDKSELLVTSEFLGEDVESGETMMRNIENTIARTNSLTPVSTGRWFPRSTRLTPDIQAGVLSTFAAYAERQYYAPQGQTNLWAATIYGPMNDRRRFVFNPSSAYTNEFAFIPTNRIIETRRLVNYDNIDRLADTILNIHFIEGNETYYAPGRPGWINSANDQRFWWSTTNPIIPDTKIIPTFGWTRNPFNQAWSGSSLTFERLRDDDVWWMSSHQWGQSITQPTEDLMLSVNVGEYTEGEWTGLVYDNCAQELLDDSMPDVITNVYPHADPYAITNKTRRLVSDRLCCMNQVLGLMDRTFQVPTTHYPSQREVRYYDRFATSTGEADSHVSFENGKYVLKVDSPITWGTVSYTNKVSVETNDYSGANLGYVVEKTSTAAESSPIMSDDGGGFFGTMFSFDVVWRIVQDHQTIPNGIYTIVPMYVSRSSSAYVTMAYYMTDETGQVVASGDRVYTPTGRLDRVSFDFAYHRNYGYHAPIGTATLGPHQPGFQAPTTESAYGMVTALAFDEHSSLVATNFLYRAQTGSFYGRGGADVVVADECGAVYNRLVSRYGYTPTDFLNIIPMVASDITRTRNSTTVTNLTLAAAINPKRYQRVRTSIIGGSAERSETYPEIWSDDPTPHKIGDGWISMYEWTINASDITNAAPQVAERDGYRLDAKIGILTRTDWDWKALKRTDD